MVVQLDSAARLSSSHFTRPFALLPFAHMITKRPVICHRHSCRGTIRRRGGPWQDGWFNKTSSNGKVVFTWLVLLVAVIDPHTFNKDNTYPLDPRHRDFITKWARRPVYERPFCSSPLLRFRAAMFVRLVVRSMRLNLALVRNNWIPNHTPSIRDTVNPVDFDVGGESIAMNERDAGRGVSYDEVGRGIVHTWSVLLPSLLRYPQTYPIAAAPYILVVLVETKKLEQQHHDLSEPTNAYAPLLFLFTYHFHAMITFGWQDILRRSCSSRSLQLEGHIRTALLVSIPCPCHLEPTDGLIPLLWFQWQAPPAKTLEWREDAYNP